MKKSLALFVVIAICISGIVYYFWDKEAKRRKKEQEEKQLRQEEYRKATHEFFKLRLVNISLANEKFQGQLKHENGYFSNYKSTLWREEFTPLFIEIKDKSFESINLAE